MLTEFSQKLEELRQRKEALFDLVNGTKGADDQLLDISQLITGTELSIGEFETRCSVILDLMENILETKEPLLVPLQDINQLNTTTEDTKGGFNSVIAEFDKLKNHGGIANITGDPLLTLVSRNDPNVTVNVGEQLRTLYKKMETLLKNIYPVLHIIQPKKFNNFNNTFGNFAKTAEKATKEYQELRTARSSADKELKATQAAHEEAERLKAEIATFQTEAEGSKNTAASHVNEADASLKKIQAVATEASTLRKTVSESQSSLDSFKKTLDERNKEYTDGKKELEDLIASLKEKEKEITEINQRAQDMLGGATIAGLAGGFGEIKNKLEVELETSKKEFHRAIWILFIATLPVLDYFIPIFSGPLRAWGFLPETSKEVSELTGFLIRIVWLFPASWLTVFAAGRYSNLFKLKEHYAYKYSIAASVDGFKKEAEGYEEEIAAASFFELTFNPADKINGKNMGERAPNPVIQWLLEKMKKNGDV